jgi:pimeloyl-ACP methyl ester carboxylesterase
MRLLALLPLLLLAACNPEPPRSAAPCPADPAFVAGGRGECVVIASASGPERASLLVVVLHGDVSAGGPAVYHRALARRIATELPEARVVALVRPGYADDAGRTSGGDLNARRDHYTAQNIEIVAGAIATLRAQSGAARVIGVGHSGGAATLANLAGLHPGTIQGAALLACPCDISTWRASTGGSPWGRSTDPYRVADQVPAGFRVVAFTGAADDNTRPMLAERYVARLSGRGISARAVSVPGATHNSVVEAAWTAGLGNALRGLAAP